MLSAIRAAGQACKSEQFAMQQPQTAAILRDTPGGRADRTRCWGPAGRGGGGGGFFIILDGREKVQVPEGAMETEAVPCWLQTWKICWVDQEPCRGDMTSAWPSQGLCRRNASQEERAWEGGGGVFVVGDWLAV